ncbi:hypothetical protein LIER_03889 [Lithospermum erythrorhizon]|uniref:Uncharacterized protein n=1 Tax=Lithospermum erythrorhizon TaxID=34254 RepID=A0AAV3NV56_LITER
MGCFVSTNKSNKEDASKPLQLNNKNSSSNTCSRAPPPNHPLIEEETVVKEVLSETPSHSKLPISRCSTNGTSPSPKVPIFSSPNARLHKPHHQNSGIFKNPRMGFRSQNQSGDLSEEASEICSSPGDSRERNNFADVDDDVSKIRIGKYRNRQVSHDRLVGNSPGRRIQASPGRSRSGSGRDGNVKRIGSETSQGRRSTSPATRVDGTTGSISGSGRCPSARRLSSGRVGSTDKPRIVEDDINYSNRDSKLGLPNNESLENPLVSLECFIFL